MSRRPGQQNCCIWTLKTCETRHLHCHEDLDNKTIRNYVRARNHFDVAICFIWVRRFGPDKLTARGSALIKLTPGNTLSLRGGQDGGKECYDGVWSMLQVVTLRTTRFNSHKFYVLPTQCTYVFCMDLRTNSDYFPVQH